MENDAPRMVHTPWSEEPVPFEIAAETGTRRVIEEHSTIGMLVTTDGSFGDIPRENYLEAEFLTATNDIVSEEISDSIIEKLKATGIWYHIIE
jgi:hypothetical protein